MTSSHLCGKVQEWQGGSKFRDLRWRLSYCGEDVQTVVDWCCRVVVGVGAAGCGQEPVHLHAHNNSIIVNNNIMAIVWLNHLYDSK